MSEYQAHLRDWDGERIAVFAGIGRVTGGLRRLAYYKRLRYPGTYALEIDGNDERVDLLDLDYRIELHRRDQAGGLDWQNVFNGFHRSDDYSMDEQGNEVYLSEGQHLNILLSAEEILYPAGSGEACKSGPAETVAKEYVNENVGPLALSFPTRGRDGIFPGLLVEADAGTGATWSGCRAYKNLLDVLIELAFHAPADFMVVRYNTWAVEFQWRAGQWGRDKTRDNTGGLAPVVFSPKLGNVQTVRYRYDRRNEINTVDVLGQGSADTRRIVTVTSGAEDDSPWARRAVARDARSTYDPDDLEAKGEEVLERQRARVETEVRVMQTEATRFGRDWDLGDLVTVEYRDFSVTQKVVAVRVSVDSTGEETIDAIMEEP